MQYLAYQYVAIVLMIAEVNQVGPKLNLPVRFPIVESDIQITTVAPPKMINVNNPDSFDLEGRFDISNFSFSFSDDGRFCYITKLHPWNHMQIRERNDFLVTQKSVINEKDAYQMATNWLHAMSVNVKKLEHSFSPTVYHEFRWRDYIVNGTKDYMPLYEVKWGAEDDPRVIVEIDGRTKELLRLRLEDDSLSERKGWGVPLRSHDFLTKIPDATFLNFSADQRSNLVSAAVAGTLPAVFGTNVFKAPPGAQP